MLGLTPLSLHGILFPLLAVCCAGGSAPPAEPFLIPVLVVSYFPTDGSNIDIDVTGDWGEGLAETRRKTERLTGEIVEALEKGSCYRRYSNPTAVASLDYEIVGTIEFREPLPTVETRGPDAPMTDYRKIMTRIDVGEWVENKGVKEVWIWAYHGGKVGIWESNMAGPFGDISNSSRDTNDLPILDRTYTVYHYNYQRGTSEAVENHMHQIESLLNYADGRDSTPRAQWPDLLFWGRFVGSDQSRRIINPGCGWSHYPPNAQRDYDWANERYVMSDIENWKPDGSGEKQRINCAKWDADSLTWFIYWMQSLPGRDNGLTYRGKPLTNWWLFVGDFDYAMQHGIGLVSE